MVALIEFAEIALLALHTVETVWELASDCQLNPGNLLPIIAFLRLDISKGVFVPKGTFEAPFTMRVVTVFGSLCKFLLN